MSLAPGSTEPVASEQPADPATTPAVPRSATCPRCASPLREDQDWCLSCGAAARSRVVAPKGWRAPLAIVAAVLALAFAGLLIAFLAVSDDSDELTRLAAQQSTSDLPAGATPTPTPPPVAPTPAPSATPAQTVPPATPGGGSDDLPGLDALPDSKSDGDDGEAPVGGADGGDVGTWPGGRSAFTVVLLSSPSRAGARKRARELAAGGTEVGVLDSDDYKSLRKGYFVVFSGQYDSRDAAEQALEGLSADAPGAYVRRVKPR